MRSKKGETGKCTCKIFLSRLFLCPQFSRTIVLSVRPQFSRTIVLSVRPQFSRTIVLSVRPQFSRAIRKTALRVYVASTVQLAPFAKPHFVLTAAGAASLLINGRSAHLIASSQILMRA